MALATPEPLRGPMSKYLVLNSGDQTSINQNQRTVVVKVKQLLKKMLIKVMLKANYLKLIMRKVQVNRTEQFIFLLLQSIE